MKNYRSVALVLFVAVLTPGCIRPLHHQMAIYNCSSESVSIEILQENQIVMSGSRVRHDVLFGGIMQMRLNGKVFFIPPFQYVMEYFFLKQGGDWKRWKGGDRTFPVYYSGGGAIYLAEDENPNAERIEIKEDSLEAVNYLDNWLRENDPHNYAREVSNSGN